MSLSEHCYREGCDGWVTGASDYCSETCETSARLIPTLGRIGEHVTNMADAMDRLREQARLATQAYEAYRAKIIERYAP